MVSRKKTETKRPLYIFTLLLVCIITVYLGFNIKDAWSKYVEGKRRLDVASENYQTLQNQYKELQELKEYEQSSTGYEAQVREKFDLVKPDEQAILLIHEDVPQIVEEEKGIKKFFNTFKNFFN